MNAKCGYLPTVGLSYTRRSACSINQCEWGKLPRSFSATHPPRGRGWDAPPPKTSGCFSSLRIGSTDLKLGLMIIDIIPHNLSSQIFPFPPKGRRGAPPLKISNRFSTLRIGPIELGGMKPPRNSTKSETWWNETKEQYKISLRPDFRYQSRVTYHVISKLAEKAVTMKLDGVERTVKLCDLDRTRYATI